MPHCLSVLVPLQQCQFPHLHLVQCEIHSYQINKVINIRCIFKHRLTSLLYIPAPFTFYLLQKFQQIRVELHDDNISNIEQEQDQCFPPLKLAIPGKSNKYSNRQSIHKCISEERSPVQVQGLHQISNRIAKC